MSDQELAFLDAAFLESDEARPIRIMAEYLEPLRRFKAQNIQDTVADIYGFEVSRHALTVYGHCRREACPNKAEAVAG